MAQCLSSFQHRHYLDIQQNSQLTVKMGIGEDAAEGPTKNQPRHACGIIDTGPKHVCVSMMHRDTRKEVPRLAQAGVLAQREGGILAQIRGPRCITRCTLRTPCGPCRSPSAASRRSAACYPARAWRERGTSSLVSLFSLFSRLGSPTPVPANKFLSSRLDAPPALRTSNAHVPLVQYHTNVQHVRPS